MQKIIVTAPAGLALPAGVVVKLDASLARRFADRVEPVKGRGRGLVTVVAPITIKAGVAVEVGDLALLGKASTGRFELGGVSSGRSAAKVSDDGEAKVSDDGEGKASDDGEGKASDDGEGKASDDGEGKASDDGEGKASDDGEGKASDDGDPTPPPTGGAA